MASFFSRHSRKRKHRVATHGPRKRTKPRGSNPEPKPSLAKDAKFEVPVAHESSSLMPSIPSTQCRESNPEPKPSLVEDAKFEVPIACDSSSLKPSISSTQCRGSNPEPKPSLVEDAKFEVPAACDSSSLKPSISSTQCRGSNLEPKPSLVEDAKFEVPVACESNFLTPSIPPTQCGEEVPKCEKAEQLVLNLEEEQQSEIEGNKIVKDLKVKYPRMSKSLLHWIISNKDDIWSVAPNNQVKLSDKFLKVLRTVFGMGYRTVCLDGGVHTKLCGVKIIRDTVVYKKNRFVKIGELQQLQTAIKDIKNLLQVIVEVAEVEEERIPVNIQKFWELCEYALALDEVDKCRRISYYLFKNPVVYDRSDEVLFILKIEFFIEMNIEEFSHHVTLKNLGKYAMRIQPSDKELNHVRAFGENMKVKEEMGAKKGKKRKKGNKGAQKGNRGETSVIRWDYRDQARSIHFLFNIIKHFTDAAKQVGETAHSTYNLDKILIEAIDRYYLDIIPVFWYCTTMSLWKKEGHDKKDSFYLVEYSNFRDVMDAKPKILGIFDEIIDRSLLL